MVKDNWVYSTRKEVNYLFFFVKRTVGQERMIENMQVVKIQQFDGTNFGNWKYLLDEKDLCKFIEKDLAENLSGVSAGEQNTIRLEEKKCMSVLVQTIHIASWKTL